MRTTLLVLLLIDLAGLAILFGIPMPFRMPATASWSVSATTASTATTTRQTTSSLPTTTNTTLTTASTVRAAATTSTTVVPTMSTTSTTALISAGAAGETARHILDRLKALEDGPRHWDDRRQRLTMRLVGREGGDRERELDMSDKRYPGDMQKTAAFFRAPAELRCTGFLEFKHPGRSAEQWLYLPELRRIRQITTALRNEKFVGTDLTYHDLDLIQEMPSWSEADATSRLQGAESIDGTPTHLIELVPRRADVGYSRIVLWLGRDDLLARQLEFYRNDPVPRRRVRQSDVRWVGAIPVPHRAEVETPSAGTRTLVATSRIEFNVGLPDEHFTQRGLEACGR